ncbi:GntR family transcriptional regulator (plasmid) [Rhodococcus rhodochrous]|uniref:GntR family transcriptional regulator n=1 Tax=Rhodococcus rhodochrous TaxID=1829 RepID=UPI00132F3F3C|nr:GntR family transcriptional regulator [Rhodococcus rhodochrous]QHG85518.1 GntR family transcriptional regulator [Rhodococcus rhodochrous]
MTAEDAFAGLGATVQRKGSADQLAEEILDRIMNGQIPPGTSLREATLASSGGVARNTAREAIRILVAEGLVQHYPHRGAVVCELDADDVRDVYRIRLMAELEGVRSVTSLSPAQTRCFDESLARFEEAARSQSISRLVAADLAFHTCIVELAGSPRLERMYRSIANEVRFGFSLLSTADREIDNPDPLIAEHREIYKKLAVGDIDTCAQLLTDHLNFFSSRMQEVVRRRDNDQQVTGS